MKRNQFFADKRQSKRSKKSTTVSEEKRTFFLPSIIPSELLSKILALLDTRESGKLVSINREWRSKIWSLLTSLTIVSGNCHLIDQLDTKKVTSLKVRDFSNSNYEAFVWLGKFINLQNLILLQPIPWNTLHQWTISAVGKIATIVPSLTSLRVDYHTEHYELLYMTNLRAIEIQSDDDFSIMKRLINMSKLNSLKLNAKSSSTAVHFHYISQLTALTHLTFDNLKIPEYIFLHVTALTNLKQLVLDHSVFVDDSGVWSSPKRIRELSVLRDLEALKMTQISPKETDLTEFKKLTKLAMEQMCLSFELPPNLKSLKVPVVLDDTFDKYAEKFINLEALTIQLLDSETNETFEKISKLQQLTKLAILCPVIKKIEKGLNALTLLPRLKVLGFRVLLIQQKENNITPQTIMKIISKIPSLTAFHCDKEKYLDSAREDKPYLRYKLTPATITKNFHGFTKF